MISINKKKVKTSQQGSEIVSQNVLSCCTSLLQQLEVGAINRALSRFLFLVSQSIRPPTSQSKYRVVSR